jgi:hypothetical protein
MCPECGETSVVPAPRPVEFPPDFDDATIALAQFVKPYTMAGPERIFAVRQAVQHIIAHDIPGDIVECGVWKGGSMMAVARTLMELGTVRRIHLFDTFEGMTDPTDVDKDLFNQRADALLRPGNKQTNVYWAYGPFEEVKRNLASTGYDPSQLVFVKGPVEQTLPAHAPERIALLRLDTDWYESTYHEMVHLYPRLSPGGVLIVDDYGHWKGCRKAVDQYIEENRLRILLTRSDYTGRMGVKPES